MRILATRLALGGLLLLGGATSGGVPTDDGSSLLELALADPAAFAHAVTAGADTDLGRADALVTWLAGHLDWTATDYRKRTVGEILRRGGGNCAELARVATSMLDTLGLPLRRVREINIHVESEQRGLRARELVAEKGDRLSVFGRRHNDHVWLEIQDRVTGEWFPADPSLGVVGEDAWLAARLGFGERFSLDPTSRDMIVPFAIFAESEPGAFETRTRHYVVDGFDRMYHGRLQGLPTWPEWVRLIQALDAPARGAFLGETSLHTYSAQIDSLAETYERLRQEYAERTPGDE